MAEFSELMAAYPEAWQDSVGTVWVSRDASLPDRTGDVWMEGILGLSWCEALENFEECKRIRARKAFWKSHPRLCGACWWTRRHYRAVVMFLGLVWRRTGYLSKEEDYRLTWSHAWGIAADLWLK